MEGRNGREPSSGSNMFWSAAFTPLQYLHARKSKRFANCRSDIEAA